MISVGKVLMSIILSSLNFWVQYYYMLLYPREKHFSIVFGGPTPVKYSVHKLSSTFSIGGNTGFCLVAS